VNLSAVGFVEVSTRVDCRRKMAHFVRLLVVLVICAPCLRMAQGAERLVDALAMYALQERTAIADGLEKDILAVIESIPDEDRFDFIEHTIN